MSEPGAKGARIDTDVVVERSPLAFLASLTVLLFAAGLESMGALMIARGASGLDWLGVVAAHLAAAGLSAEGLLLRRRAISKRRARLGFYQAGWLLGFAFPIFGPWAALLLALLFPEPKGGSFVGESAEEQRSQAARAAMEKRRGEQQLDQGLEAIVDALKDRDPKKRIAAIDALAGDTSPRAAKLLADAKENTIFDVRVRAVQALAKLGKEHGERLAAARRALDADPLSTALNRDVAQLCFDYAALGVEDAKMCRALYEQARLLAQTAVDLGDKSRPTLLVLARALGELGLHEEAEQIYRQMLLAFDKDVDALMGIAESQFARRAFALLPLTSRWVLHQAGKSLDAAAIDSLKFWLRGEGAEAFDRVGVRARRGAMRR